jgi:hypothetical protein
MQSLGIKKTHRASGLLLALVASTLMLGACGDGIFFSSESPTTTAAATDNTTTTPTPAPSATPTPTPTPATGTEPTASVPAPAPAPGAAPTPAPTPAPAPAPAPAPTPSAGSIGKTLWANNCQGCHAGFTILGKSASFPASTTLSAIASNKGGMGYLSGSIGATEASQIATYAASPGSY